MSIYGMYESQERAMHYAPILKRYLAEDGVVKKQALIVRDVRCPGCGLLMRNGGDESHVICLNTDCTEHNILYSVVPAPGYVTLILENDPIIGSDLP